MHPLEALYRRPKHVKNVADGGGHNISTLPNASTPQKFSFFEESSMADEDDVGDIDEDGQSKQVRTAAGGRSSRMAASASVTGLVVPMTPFTRQDSEWRGQRSAAPTPDTAHPGRSFGWTVGRRMGNVHSDADDDENNDKDVEVDQDWASGKMAIHDNGGRNNGVHDDGASGDGGENENEASANQPATVEAGFQAWFWENRGNLNRAWRKRRKQVAKDKRRRENRAKGARAI